MYLLGLKDKNSCDRQEKHVKSPKKGPLRPRTPFRKAKSFYFMLKTFRLFFNRNNNAAHDDILAERENKQSGQCGDEQ